MRVMQISGRGGGIPHEAAAMAAPSGLPVGKGASARDRAHTRYAAPRIGLSVPHACCKPIRLLRLAPHMAGVFLRCPHKPGATRLACDMLPLVNPLTNRLPNQHGGCVQGRQRGCRSTSCRCWAAAPQATSPVPARRLPAPALMAKRSSPGSSWAAGAGGECWLCL